jgi:hypothetical protein
MDTTSACRSCGAWIWWLVTAAGKRMPVNPTPDPAGNLAVNGPGDLRVLRAGEEPPESGWSRHTSHFATCPNADQHRKAR